MFKVKCTFSGNGKEVAVVGGRSALWKAQDYASALPDTDSKNARTDYAWAYFLAKNASKLEELGCPDGSFNEAIDYLADSFDIAFEQVEDEAPLVFTPDK